MAHTVCPSWLGRLLLCPFRRLGQNPVRILSPYVANGMTVLEVGPGMGYFTLPMARMVGPTSRVLCIDLQEKMLAAVRRRAANAGLADRIETQCCQSDTLGIADLAGRADFVLLFYVAHEVPDVGKLFGEVARAMKPDARCLLAEPKFHVSEQEFDKMLAAAGRHGLQPVDRPRIRGSRTAMLALSSNDPRDLSGVGT